VSLPVIQDPTGVRRGGMNLGGPEMLIVLAVVLLIFGSKKVPELARSLGKAQKEFKDGMKEGTTPSDGA
jgi:sec-independent protein translocase protein TatA